LVVASRELVAVICVELLVYLCNVDMQQRSGGGDLDCGGEVLCWLLLVENYSQSYVYLRRKSAILY